MIADCRLRVPFSVNYELRRYPAYKPSSIPWLGNVPAHWEHRKLRSILHRTNERDRPDLHLLSVVRERGVILRDVTYADENHNVIPEDLSNYKVVRKGQFAMNKMKAWQGSYGVSQHTGIVSPAYFTFDINGVTGEFLHVALRSKAYVPFFTAASDGVRIGQWDLSQSQMREIPLWIPPLPEQRAIARYLDYMDRRIQRYIEAKERLIELLEERKRVVINQAVTRGLNPDVPLKPSGVEWLGDVPAHWEVRRLKHWVGINDEVLNESTDSDYRFKYIDIASVNVGRLTEQPQRLRFGEAQSRARRIIKHRDTIISTVRTYLKAVWHVDARGSEDLICSTGFAVLRPLGGTVPKFVSHLVQSDSFADRVTASSVGVAYPAIAESKLASFHVAIPPQREQTQIVDYLDTKIVTLDSQRSCAHRQIELIKEYRTRLIADVVTGKLDVRDAARLGVDDEVGSVDYPGTEA